MTHAPNRRRFRFSLRTFLVLVALVGVWLGVSISRARARKAANEAIDNLGGSTAFYETGPQWLRRLVDDDRYFHDAARITLGFLGPKYDFKRPFTDDDLERMVPHIDAFSRFEQLDLAGSKVTDDGLGHLQKLRGLAILDLSNTAVSDKGVMHLQSIPALRHINLLHTQVSPAGVDKLQCSLPGCTIEN